MGFMKGREKVKDDSRTIQFSVALLMNGTC